MSKKEEKDDGGDLWIVILIIGAISLIILWYHKLRFLFSKKINKGALAKEYGVENKILMKWLKLFGSSDGVAMYYGTQIKKVKRTYFTAFLGEPGSGPKYKDKPIVKKDDIWRVVDSNETTVREKLIALEQPEEVIGMSYSTYKSLSYVPPVYMTKIVTFLKKGTPPKEDFPDFFDEKGS